MTLKNWQVHLGRHEFFMDGKIIIGPNKINVIMTLILANFLHAFVFAGIVLDIIK